LFPTTWGTALVSSRVLAFWIFGVLLIKQRESTERVVKGGSAVAKQRLAPTAVFVPGVSRSSAPAPTAVSKLESLKEAKNSAGKNALRLIQIF
jgi:hypothetical protein